MMSRVALSCVLLIATCACCGCADGLRADSIPRAPAVEQQFEELLAKHGDLTYEQLTAETPQRNYVQELSFDPATVKFYGETVERLQLTEREQEMLRSRGLVSVDHDQRYSFGSAYHAIYSSDLPVLVTTDSILHAMHRSYDDLLMEMEQTFFTTALEQILYGCHERLAGEATRLGRTAASYRDVDLYLTVARNLLQGAGAPAGGRIHPALDAWAGDLLVGSKLDQDREALEILNLIQSLVLQSAQEDKVTQIYGGERAIDYSQFQPRGHYSKTTALKRYFRTMMWLGRADTGWNVLPPDPVSEIVSDTPRELRNAVLLTQLLESTGTIEQLRQMSEILDFLVGESDELTVFQLRDLLRQQKIEGVGDLASGGAVAAFQQALLESDLGSQRIRSQVVASNIYDLHQVPPPSMFQLFGQRYAVDSFVLSKVVFDSIIFDGKKVQRYMPTGLDVMFAMGNDSVLPLLEPEMAEHPYAANLKAGQEFVGQHRPGFWQKNLYNLWLDALRTLSADLTTEPRLPEAMRTEAWQRKQLQTQLASWAELRHDTVLYAKQSYSAEDKCEYPAGYVEPYPETYARIKAFAEEAARRIEASDFDQAGHGYAEIERRQVEFFRQMGETLGRLEGLARKELAAEPFTAEESLWLKKLIDIRSRGSGRPTYSGWYCQLFYGGGHRAADWDPTVTDVHTDPNKKMVLQQGVGSCNFLVAAIDNEADRMIYVGPVYSYYDFHRPAEGRLTDEQWQRMLIEGAVPDRPGWVSDFQAPKQRRSAGVIPSQ